MKEIVKENRQLLRYINDVYLIHIDFIKSLLGIDLVNEDFLIKLGEPFIFGYYDILLLIDRFLDEELGEKLSFWYECYSKNLRFIVYDNKVFINMLDLNLILCNYHIIEDTYQKVKYEGIREWLNNKYFWRDLDELILEISLLKEDISKKAALYRLTNIKQSNLCDKDVEIDEEYFWTLYRCDAKTTDVFDFQKVDSQTSGGYKSYYMKFVR